MIINKKYASIAGITAIFAFLGSWKGLGGPMPMFDIVHNNDMDMVGVELKTLKVETDRVKLLVLYEKLKALKADLNEAKDSNNTVYVLDLEHQIELVRAEIKDTHEKEDGS